MYNELNFLISRRSMMMTGCMLLFFGFTSEVFSQVPQKFAYQAIVRNADGDIFSNQNVTMKFSIRSNSPVGVVNYSEQQTLVTNEFGIVNCNIGDGVAGLGAMNSPQWGTVSQFLQVEVNLGNGFVDMGTSQLLSVPHSFVSDFALDVDLNLDEVSDVDLGPVSNKDVLFYDLNHWEAGTASEVLTAGPGITIVGNTISNSGDLGSNDANTSLSNLSSTGVNTNLSPLWDQIIDLGSSTMNWGSLYVGNHIFLDYGSDVVYDNQPYIQGPYLFKANTCMGIEAGDASDGTSNSFYGSSAGKGISSGVGNSCFGASSGSELSSGSYNACYGQNAGYEIANGTQNSYFGANAGSNGVGVVNNTYIGFRAGRDNASGNNNVYVGSEAGMSGNGENNTAIGAFSTPGGGGSSVVVGYQAGSSFTSATQNTYVGTNSGGGNGSNNVCVGFDAGGNQTTGDQNTFIGYSAEGSDTYFENVTAIGYQASVTASNRVRIGNGNITQIGGQVGWSTLSDARMKTNVKPASIGLEFINKLNPVTYNYIEGNTDITYTGFLAQDVEKVLEEMNIEFSAVTKPENEKDLYAIRYSEFVVPLTNAVQEQQLMIESLISKIEVLQSEMDKLKAVNHQN